jgi:hypothetical protein
MGRVVHPANQELTQPALLLEVAPQAEIGVPLGQQTGVDGPMRAVAGRAAFAQGLVLEHVRASLGVVAF